MRFVKGISLFFIYPLIMLSIGFSAGVMTMDYFYPNNYLKEQENAQEQKYGAELLIADSEETENVVISMDETVENPIYTDVAMMDETLNADTDYVLREVDLVRNTMVETVLHIPGKYIGMNRSQFLESMEDYEAYPPLSELERGFVSLEVLAFSAERVTIQNNYLYVQPSDSFYLAVCENEVIVLLEDKETVYINTGIVLDTLPEAVQMEIIQMLWVEDEAELYNFLEHYSS